MLSIRQPKDPAVRLSKTMVVLSPVPTKLYETVCHMMDDLWASGLLTLNHGIGSPDFWSLTRIRTPTDLVRGPPSGLSAMSNVKLRYVLQSVDDLNSSRYHGEERDHVHRAVDQNVHLRKQTPVEKLYFEVAIEHQVCGISNNVGAQQHYCKQEQQQRFGCPPPPFHTWNAQLWWSLFSIRAHYLFLLPSPCLPLLPRSLTLGSGRQT
ncbi:hypothetical protein Mapa_002795 [Marchantia paleacea]|nr:hypothetical protein Mapa_002795 [Marchantia paleacea]